MNQAASEFDVHELELLVGKSNTTKPLAMYQQMLLTLLTSLNKQTEVDKKWLVSVAHQIKSSARQLHLVSLAGAAEQLEAALLTDKLSAQDITDFKLQISQAESALAAFLVANKLDK